MILTFAVKFFIILKLKLKTWVRSKFNHRFKRVNTDITLKKCSW